MKKLIATAVFALTFAGAASAATITAEYDATSAVGSGADHSIWISGGLGAGIGSDFDFDPAGRFTLYDDGTATLKGSIVSQTRADAGFTLSFDYDSVFDGFTPKFKSENGSKEVLGSTFFRDMEGGTLIGTGVLAGLNLSVSRKPVDGPYATQIGPSNGTDNGANNKNKNFGMANWFMINVDSATCSVCSGNSVIANLNGKQGDVNVDLAAVPIPAAGYLMFGGLFALAGLRRRRRKTA